MSTVCDRETTRTDRPETKGFRSTTKLTEQSTQPRRGYLVVQFERQLSSKVSGFVATSHAKHTIHRPFAERQRPLIQMHALQRLTAKSRQRANFLGKTENSNSSFESQTQ